MSSSIVLHSKKFDAAIFDMDGTMIDNMEYHKKAWKQFLKQHNVTLTDREFSSKYSGKKNDVIFRDLFGERLSDRKIEKLADEKEALYRTIYSPYITEIEGLTQAIKTFKTHHVKVAIATTAPEANRNWGLSKLKLDNEFEVILGDEHVDNGKPHPEIYLKTAKQLDVLPEKCIVFDDSPPGVLSAKNAGMYVVGVLSTHSMHELSAADAFIDNFLQIEVQ